MTKNFSACSAGKKYIFIAVELYYSSYIPQFFYAMLAPFILFFITVWIEWRVAVILLCCVPLIPVSIVAVSKCAKLSRRTAGILYRRLDENYGAVMLYNIPLGNPPQGGGLPSLFQSETPSERVWS